jgi:O-antigen/teichoic acid export membrane protein
VRRAIEQILPRERFGDQRDIIGGAGQNVLGLGAGAIATFAATVLMTRVLGRAQFGVVTFATQFAFVGAAATRFGMDVANVRLIAILIGRGERGRVRGLARRTGAIATTVSVPAGIAVFLLARPLAEAVTGVPDAAVPAFRAAGLAMPLAAIAQTYLGATRGLKMMRYNLYGFWIAQPFGWIALSLLGWAVARTAGITTLAYAGSWALALIVGWWGWERETRPFAGGRDDGGIPEERPAALLRFGGLRAPGTLFSQLLFWTDFGVFSILMAKLGDAGARQVGVYGAALRAGQALFLFLTSVSLMFSPFVADLHHRGERERLDGLYKSVTRWTLGATIPILLVLALLPGPVLRVFGDEYAGGESALRILIVGLIFPVIVGTVGFILIMVGRTGWDLLVYVAAFGIDVGLALALARPEALGIRGAAVAQAATLSFSAVARLLLVRRLVGIWPFDRHFLRLLPAAAIGAAAMLLVAAAPADPTWYVSLVFAGGAGIVAYAVALLAFGLKPSERAVARSLVGRLLGRSRPAAG